MWKEENNRLLASFKFANFTQAFSFMTEVAFVCERMDHHPDWQNVYNQVNIQLSTHSEGNTVTDKDHKLATEIDKIYLRRKTK